MQQRQQQVRAGFTLVELIVVLSIIATIAALTALYFPRYQDKEMVARGADNLQGWLLNARQRAKRDGLPTGLVLMQTTNPQLNQGVNCVIECRYIQQPDDFAVGLYVGRDAANPKWARFTGPPSPPNPVFDLKILGGPLTDANRLKIQTGDYLEIFGSGVLRRIGDPNRAPPLPPEYPILEPAGQPGITVELDPIAADLPGLPSPPPALQEDSAAATAVNPMPKPNQRTNYRIIAQPREISGEQKLYMPDNIGIDLNPNNPLNPSIDPTSGTTRPMSRNLPTRNGRIEILFAPSGSVIGAGTTSGKIILWVRDLTKSNTNPVTPELLAGSGTLITVDPRTGFIAAHQATNGADPYQFTRDGRSSGL